MIFLLLVLALFASAMFAGAETGFYGLNPMRLQHESKHTRAAAILLPVLSSPSAFLATLLIGNNLANDAAVKAAGEIGAVLGWSNPEFVGAIILTPLVFLFGEVLPKQFFLARPQRLLHLAVPLAAARFLFWPLTAPLAALARALEGDTQSFVLARRQFAALLQEGSQHPPGEARVMAAALRAMEAHGQDLQAFLRMDLPQFAAETTVSEVAKVLAQQRDTLGLVPQEEGPPALLLGTRLALAPAEACVADVALPLPQLESDLDLSAALTQLRALGVAFAWVEKPGSWAGLCDLEYALAQLLAPNP